MQAGKQQILELDLSLYQDLFNTARIECYGNHG